MNVELLERVKAHILEEPKRLFMPYFISRKEDDSDGADRYPACGTIGCYAGWICELNGVRRLPHEPPSLIPETAADLADLSLEQANRLFYCYPETWSQEDSLKLWSGDGTPETAALAARRIDEFIASDGAL